MSHTTTLKTIQIKSVAALQEAVEFLSSQGINCELQQNVVPRMYYDNQVGKCDYVLKLRDCAYDVGFQKQDDGSYLPVYDSWAGHLQNVIGSPTTCEIPTTEEGRQAASVARLLDCYAVHAAKKELEDSGAYYNYTVLYNDQDGSYTLEAEESY